MPRPLQLLVDFIAYNGTQSNNPADAHKIKNRVEENNVSGVVRYENDIADGVTDKTILLAGSPAEYLLIFADREITAKLNGGTEVYTLKPSSNGVKSFVFFLKGEITGLEISNSSGEVVSVDVISVEK